MELEPFVAGIKKTGYPLEYATVQTLLDEGWSVISNKYYLDKDENKPREVDVLAYRCDTTHKDFDVYTALLISCKKSEHGAWAFLTRDINLKDKNIDWEPVHFWTDCKPLNYVVESPDWAKKYHQAVRGKEVKDILDQPISEVFAFQEMSAFEVKANGRKEPDAIPIIERRPNGDSAIFGSVMSLMKAQNYEMSARGKKKRKKPAIYQFNLISLAQTEFVRLHFKGEKIEPAEIDSTKYIAHYIIEQEQTFARVLFIRSSKFREYLKNYTALHKANYEILKFQVNEFYRDIVKDGNRLNIFVDEFKSKLKRHIWLHLPAERDTYNIDPMWFWWDEGKSTLNLEVGACSDQIIKLCMENQEILDDAKKLMKEIYRYEGELAFSDDVPF